MPSLSLRGLHVEYIDSGNGMAAVFVPGLEGSKDCFGYQVSGLSDRYRVISYDLRRASGRSEYSLRVLADDLANIVRALRLRGTAVVGHSFGALIALQYAADHPESCLGLVLTSSTPSYPHLAPTDLICDLIPGGIPEQGLWTRLWRRIIGRQPGKTSAEGASCGAKPDRATVQARLKVMRDNDLSGLLERIAAPTLIIAGAQEEAYVLAGSQLMYQRIPDATLEVVENCDQSCYRTRHDIFNGMIADFLGQSAAID